MSWGNLPGKLARAVAHYLAGQGVAPLEQIFWQGSNREWSLENGPALVIRVGRGEPSPILTGNRTYTVYVSVRGSAATHPDQTDPDAARVAFDNLVGATMDALMRSDDGQSLAAVADAITAAGRALAQPADETEEALAMASRHADMADFTLLYWQDDGDGEAEGGDCDWEILLQFKAICCAAALQVD